MATEEEKSLEKTFDAVTMTVPDPLVPRSLFFWKGTNVPTRVTSK